MRFRIPNFNFKKVLWEAIRVFDGLFYKVEDRVCIVTRNGTFCWEPFELGHQYFEWSEEKKSERERKTKVVTSVASNRIFFFSRPRPPYHRCVSSISQPFVTPLTGHLHEMFQEDLLLKKKNAAALFARKIHFREMKESDPQYELLRQKYRPINKPLGASAGMKGSGKFSYTEKMSQSKSGTDFTADNTLTTTMNAISSKEVSLFPASQLSTHWRKIYKIGPGLENAGNTCFLNSVLQCLTYTPPLINYLLSKQHSSLCTLSRGGLPTDKFC